jgi:hypothetical protein
MKTNIETLKFRTKWLHHTIKVLKTSCENYHADTQIKIEQMIENKKLKPAT